jgi:hypothetical protein
MNKEAQGGSSEDTRDGVEGLFKKGIIVIGIILGLIAAIQLFFAINRFISVWFTYRYQPIFQSIYSAAILVVVIYAIRTYIKQ